MRPFVRRTLVALLLAVLGVFATDAASAQALPSTLVLSVRHSTLKNMARPEGALKAQIDSIDVELAGAEVVYIEVPGGNHTAVVEPNLAGMFDFFDKHRARAAPKP